MSQVSISNIINVSVSQVPIGITAGNVNVGLILSHETPDNSDAYRIYVDAQNVGQDYGTSSITYQMAVNVFAQQPNILGGGGALIVAPYNATNVSATQGNFVTDNIAANISAFALITNGVLKVTLDGTIIQLANLNFTGVTTLAQIAKIFQNVLPDAIVSATSTTITFTSKKVGSDSTVALAAGSGIGTDLTGSSYLDVSAGAETDGANATLGETPTNAIARLLNVVSFYWAMTTLELSDAQCETLAATVQSYNRSLIFLHHFASQSSFASIGASTVSAKQDQFRCLFYSINPAEANLMKAAYAGRMFSVDFAGSNVALTDQLKQLANVVADSGINQTVLTQAYNAGMDSYPNITGYAGIYSSGENNFFDNVYNAIWLKINLQVAGFNALASVGGKLPQTESGVSQIKNAFAKVCVQAISNGIIGNGITWNGPTFGDQKSFLQNVFTVGYYIYNSPVATQSPSDRALRKAPPIQIAVQFAGAIHSISAIININT